MIAAAVPVLVSSHTTPGRFHVFKFDGLPAFPEMVDS